MNRTKILIWVIVLLLATNVATIISAITYSWKMRNKVSVKTEVPFTQRAGFFQEQLNLNQAQRLQFMQFNRSFNQTARPITKRLSLLRYQMIDELAKSKPDQNRLDEICKSIGELHVQLKSATVNYYLEMKNICDSPQQEKLHELFQVMLDAEGNINMMQPGRGMQHRGMGRGWQNRNNIIMNQN